MSETAETVTVETLLSEQDWLRALARRLVRDESRADDLLQDVFVRVISSPPRTVRSLRAWLTRMLVNRHRDVARSEGARADREERAAPRRPIPSAAELAARVDAQRQVAAAVVELDEPLRETVLLHFYEDLSVRAIGRRMGVPYETARARLRRGLDRLRARLAPSEDGQARRWSSAFLALAGLDRTKQVAAAAAALTGAVIVMKQKIAVVAAVLVLLAVGGGIWKVSRSDPGAPVPDRAPEERAEMPDKPIAVPVIGDSASTNSAAAGETKPAEEPLDPDRGTCHGRITNPDGTPAVGVSVRLSDRPAKVVQTDRDGRFRITNEWVDPSGRALFVGAPTGLLVLGNVPLRAGADVTFDAVLPVGRPLAVEVVSAVDGRPLSGVWVAFDPLDEPEFPRAMCITDEDGRGGFAVLPPREYRVYLASEGFQPYTHHLDLTGAVRPDVLRVELEDPEEFHLRVTPPPLGKNVQAFVTFLPQPADPVKGKHGVLVKLTEAGTAVGIAPPPGRYRVHVNVLGVLGRWIEGLEVREREPVEINLSREIGVEVRGILLGPDGLPLSGTVTLSPNAPVLNRSARQAWANESGEFVLTGFPPCRCAIDVQLGKQSFFRLMRDVEVGAGGVADLEVHLPRGGKLIAKITGSPLPNAHAVHLYRRTAERLVLISHVSTDDHGVLQAEYLPPGRVYLLARAFLPELGWARPVEVEIKDGETAGPIEIPWLSCPPVELIVTRSDDFPVRGKIKVESRSLLDGVAGQRWLRFEETLDENGHADIRSIPPGRFLVQVTLAREGVRPRFASTVVEVKEGRNDPIRLSLSD